MIPFSGHKSYVTINVASDPIVSFRQIFFQPNTIVRLVLDQFLDQPPRHFIIVMCPPSVIEEGFLRRLFESRSSSSKID